MTRRRRPDSLWRHHDFLRLWAGETVSALGSAVTDLALPTLAVLQLNASPAQVGLLLACGRLPFPLLAIPVGALVDRMRRRPLMIATDVGRFAVLGSIPILAALGDLRIWVLYLLAAVAGVLTVVFDLAYMAYVPVVVSSEQLGDATARVNLTYGAASTGGPGLSGVLIQLFGAARAVSADAVSFLVSAVAVLSMRTPERPPDTTSRLPITREIAEGVSHVVRQPVLRSLLLLMTGLIFAVHAAEGVLVVFAYRTLHLSPGGFGGAMIFLGVGAMVGASLAPTIARRVGFGRGVAVFHLLGALGVSAAALALVLPAIPMLVAAFLVQGTATAVGDVMQVTTRQALTPDRLRGRMNSVFRALFWGAWPLGNLLGGAAGSLIGTPPVIVVGGLVGAAFCAAMWFTPLVHVRTLPTSAAELVPSATLL